MRVVEALREVIVPRGTEQLRADLTKAESVHAVTLESWTLLRGAGAA